MSENTEPVEPTKPFIKKENTLPIVAIALSGVALAASLFTVSAANAQPNHAPDHQFSNSQENRGQQNNQDNMQRGDSNENTGRHGDRQRGAEQAQKGGTPEVSQSQPSTQNTPQQMPKMNGQTGAS